MDDPRRKHPRINVSLTALEKETEANMGHITDISIVGCFVETQSPYQIDSLVDIKFMAPHELNNISSRGRVSRITPNGIGVEFFAMPPEYKSVLREFIRKEMGAIKIIDRRKNHRILLPLPIFNENNEKIGVTKNISSVGFLAELENISPVGTELKLIFKLPNDGQFIYATARVARIEENLMGFDFIDLKKEDVKNIETLIQQFSDDPII